MGSVSQLYAPDLEAAILGGLIINPTRKAEVANVIQPGDFSDPTNRAIYEAVLAERANELNPVTVIDRVKRAAGVDPTRRVFDLVEQVHTSAGIVNVAERLRERRQRLALYALATEAGSAAADLTADLGATLATVKAGVRRVEAAAAGDEERDFLRETWKEMEQRHREGTHCVGILSGYPEIDEQLLGFEPASLTYIIARPSVGKTALCLNVAENMCRNGATILFYSLEMSGKALSRRRLAAESGVYLSKIRSGNVEGAEWHDLLEAQNNLYGRRFLIRDDTRFKAIETLSSHAAMMAMDNKLAAIFVDHVQLMRSRDKHQSRHHEIGFISNSLKDIAKDLNVPVIALCQLSRKIEDRTDRRPLLSDMKESGDLEQDADNVIGLYREKEESDELFIAGLKGRDSGQWRQEVLRFDKYTQRIRSIGRRGPA